MFRSLTRVRLHPGDRVALTASYGPYMPGDVGAVVYVTWRGEPIVAMGPTETEEISARRRDVALVQPCPVCMPTTPKSADRDWRHCLTCNEEWCDSKRPKERP